MVMTNDDGEVCERCQVDVFDDGRAVANYRWADNDCDGVDSFDEDVSEWSDDEIRGAVAALVGIDVRHDLIEVRR